MGNDVSSSRQRRVAPEDAPRVVHPQILQIIAERKQGGGNCGERRLGLLRNLLCFFTTRSNANATTQQPNESPCLRFENCHFHRGDIKLLCDFLLSNNKTSEEEEPENNNNIDQSNVITQLKFTRCSIGQNSAHDVAPICDSIRSGNKSSGIQSLSMSFQRLENQAVSDIFQALLHANSNIVEMKLEYNIISGGSAAPSGEDLYKLLVQNERLRILSLRGSHRLGLNGAKYIAQGLTYNTTLTSLNLCACGLTNDDVTSIFATLCSSISTSEKLVVNRCSALRYLDLSFNDEHVTSEILGPAARVLQSSKLESLNLSGNRRLFQQQNTSVEEFAKALASERTNLSQLELKNVGLTASTGTLIFCALETSNITILDISENHQLDSRAAVVPLLAHLPHWRNLQQCTLDARRLCLACNCRGNDETNGPAPSFLLAVQQNTSIQVLNLRPTLVFNYWQYLHGGTYPDIQYDNNEYWKDIKQRIKLVMYRNQQLSLARSIIVHRPGDNDDDDDDNTVPAALWPDILEKFSLLQEVKQETAEGDEEEGDELHNTLRKDATVVYYILREKLPCFTPMRHNDVASAWTKSVTATRTASTVTGSRNFKQVGLLFGRYALATCSWTYLVVDEDRGGWAMFHSVHMPRLLVVFLLALCTFVYCAICWQVLVLMLETRDIPHRYKPYLYIPFITCLIFLEYSVAGHHYEIVSLSLQGVVVAVIQALLIHGIRHASQCRRSLRRHRQWWSLAMIMGRTFTNCSGRSTDILRHCPILLWTLVVTLNALQSAL